MWHCPTAMMGIWIPGITKKRRTMSMTELGCHLQLWSHFRSPPLPHWRSEHKIYQWGTFEICTAANRPFIMSYLHPSGKTRRRNISTGRRNHHANHHDKRYLMLLVLPCHIEYQCFRIGNALSAHDSAHVKYQTSVSQCPLVPQEEEKRSAPRGGTIVQTITWSDARCSTIPADNVHTNVSE